MAMIQAISARARAWKKDYSDLPISARLYGAGLGLFLLVFVAAIVRAPGTVVQPLTTVAGIVLIVGFVVEAYVRLVSIVKATWLKWAAVPAASMVVAASLGGASHVVSEATAQDPSYFPLAVSFLAPLAVLPLLAFIATIFLGFLSLALMLSLGVGDTFTKNRTPKPTWLPFARVLGVISTMLALIPMIDAGSPLSGSTLKVAGWAAYALDMHKDTECGFDKSDRVKRINDSLVIRMQRNVSGPPTFVRQTCELGPQ
jgi:hypothetical protein